MRVDIVAGDSFDGAGAVSTRRFLIILCAITLLLQIPLGPAPAGLDTRSFSSFSPQNLGIFLTLVVGTVILNVVALFLFWKRSRFVRYVALTWAVAGVVTAVGDLSGIVGPVPNVSYTIVVLITLGIVFAIAWMSWTRLTSSDVMDRKSVRKNSN